MQKIQLRDECEIRLVYALILDIFYPSDKDLNYARRDTFQVRSMRESIYRRRLNVLLQCCNYP
jgi:hypothetical protein